VVAAAKSLIKRGAKNVLVTLAERGSLLMAADGSVTRQAALPVPGGVVVDATAAGGARLACMSGVQSVAWQLCQQRVLTITASCVRRSTLQWSFGTVSTAGTALTGWQYTLLFHTRTTAAAAAGRCMLCVTCCTHCCCRVVHRR
jgi:fructose-1-phosphate kinase PfkB-like protein